MESSFKVEVISPSRRIGTYEAVLLTVPGAEGYMGLGRNHTPFLSLLKPGTITIEPATGEASIRFFVASGQFEFFANKAVILAEIIENPNEIDEARAKTAEERAEARLRETTDQRVDIARALAALARAKARRELRAKQQQHR